jgi:hypothetical protein
MKLTLDELKLAIDTYDIPDKSSELLSHAFKIAKTRQDDYRQNSAEFKLLESFKSKLLKAIKSKQKFTMDEMDQQIAQEQAAKQQAIIDMQNS